MPFTVITLTSVPQALRGDLTKWMQEISTGVYIGNFSTRIREELWERVVESVGKGQATISYHYNNESGYLFETHQTQRKLLIYDGVPLVLHPNPETIHKERLRKGFSDAALYRKIQKSNKKKLEGSLSKTPNFVVVDIETDGLDPSKNHIIEIAAVKISDGVTSEYNSLVASDKQIPEEIVLLTGITNETLSEQGRNIEQVLSEFIDFISDFPMIGYSFSFDVEFLNCALSAANRPKFSNSQYDLKRYVKMEKPFLNNYKLKNVLHSYGISDLVVHRALDDARATVNLLMKVNGCLQDIESNCTK